GGRGAHDAPAPRGAGIPAAVRCAPPLNKPTIPERDACAPFLARELEILDTAAVIVALGQFGRERVPPVLGGSEAAVPRPRRRFGHGPEVAIGDRVLIGSYHPSQQNTFTGKLTAPMFTAVLARARDVAGLRAFLGRGGAHR